MKKIFSIIFVLLTFLLSGCDLELSSGTTDDLADDSSGEFDDDATDYNTDDDSGYYTPQSYNPMTGFTKEEVLEHYNKNYTNTTVPAGAVTGFDIAGRDCGSMTTDGLADFRRRVNFFLSFWNLPPVGEPDSATNAKCQEAALSMVVQKDISHTPLDVGYDYANETSQEAASQSNLAIFQSSYSYGYTSLLDNLILDTGVASTGHRRWFLLPGQKGAGYGYLYDYDQNLTFSHTDALVQWTFTYDEDPDYDKPVMYPPAGAFPIEFTIDDFDRVVSFTLYWLEASFNNCSVSISDQNGSSIPVTIVSRESYSQYSMPPAALIWTVGSDPEVGDKWTITIDGISGKDQSSITYTTEFMELGLRRSPSYPKVGIR